jgi:hypothetical protein
MTRRYSPRRELDVFDINWSRKIKVSGFVSFNTAGQPLHPYSSIPIAAPEGIQLEDNGLERLISWRWFSWHSMRAIIFAAIFSVPVGFMLYAYLNSSDKSWPTAALAIALTFALPPAVTIYGWLAYLFNRTTVRVDSSSISVRHGPLPWLRAKDVAKADIDTIISEMVINDSDSSDGTIFQPREIYRVRLKLKTGKTVKLVNGLRRADEALFIEQQIWKS